MANRYECLKLLAPRITDELVVTSIASVNHEWYQLLDREGNLYHITMSVASSVALGLALVLPHRRVICLDGDGSMLMGLPILADIARQNPPNLITIVFDDECYGGPSKAVPVKLDTHTAGPADLVAIAQGAGIRYARLVRENSEFEEAIDGAYKAKDASFITVKVEYEYRFPAPPIEGPENKYRFVRYIEKTENLKLIG